MFRQAKRLLSKRSEQTVKQRDSSTLNIPALEHNGAQIIEFASHQPTRSSGTLHDVASVDPAPSPQTIHESRFGLKELVSQPPEKRDAVDIIAIHGLNGDREGTWTDSTTKINWLCDVSCLPKDVPNARVLSFGYKSVTYFSRADSDVRDFASELLAAVKASRRSNAEKHRPIVFICHSLGGLVFKQAIVRAHEQDQFYSSLLENVRGVIFFATPHRGSSLAFWDLIGTRIIQAATLGFTTNPKLSKDLKVDSEILKQISDSFVSRGWSIKIRSFYETEFMTGLNCRVVEKDSARLGWGNELDIASPANHSSICKFASATDHRYQTAIDAILDVIGALDEITDRPLSEREVNCISRLNSEYEHHLDQVDNPVSGTCEWVLAHKVWQQWQSWAGSSLLWITSNAGCGKSVMAKFLVNYFKAMQGVNSTQNFGYFFFMDGIAGQDNATAAVSALLHQLCQSQHGIIKHALKKLEGSLSHNFNKFSILWQIVIDIINDKSAKDILWVLDGVEECEAQSLRYFMKVLSAFLESHYAIDGLRHSCRLKIVLLSRPSSLIQQALGLFSDKDSATIRSSDNKFRLTGEDENQAITADILRFAHSKIDELTLASALPETVLKRLGERLVAGADFTFLWISLIIKVVEDSTLNGISIAQLEKILQSTNLDNVYQQLLEAPSKAFPSKTRKFLSIVLASTRPLTIDEMCVAIEVEENDYTEATPNPYFIPIEESINQITPRKKRTKNFPDGWRADNTSVTDPQSLDILKQQLHRPFDNHIRQLCGHFIRIRCRKIYLVHQTARTFLSNVVFELRYSPQPTPPLPQSFLTEEHITPDNSTRMWHPIKQDEAIKTLLNVCVSYIKIFAREGEGDIPQMWDEAQIAKHIDMCKEDLSRAFFPYAAVEWVRHYRSVRKTLNSKYDELLQPDTKLFHVWVKLHSSWAEERIIRRDVDGAKWINVSEDDSHVHESSTFWKLWRQFQELDRWLHGDWYIKSSSKKGYQNIIRLRQRLERNTKFNTLKEFFDTIQPRRNQPIFASLDQINRLLIKLKEEWSQATNECDDYKFVLIEERPGINYTTHIQGIEQKIDMEEKLFEALMHFDLLNLSEAGLDEDEFLCEYWQSKSIIINGYSGEYGGEYKEEYEDDGTIEHEDSIPDRVKHYIRQRRENVMASRYMPGVTPGVQLPGLSNPETLSFDSSVGLMLASSST